LHRTVHEIRRLGLKAGVAINPATPASVLSEILPDLDLVLVMTVNPGFGGQPFIAEMIPKVQQAFTWRAERGLSYRIEVDGGINNDTAAECARAGADTFVSGSALFSKPQLKAAVEKMRKRVTAVRRSS
jgi:ribulose-phosphate 3-epimerase